MPYYEAVIRSLWSPRSHARVSVPDPRKFKLTSACSDNRPQLGGYPHQYEDDPVLLQQPPGLSRDDFGLSNDDLRPSAAVGSPSGIESGTPGAQCLPDSSLTSQDAMKATVLVGTTRETAPSGAVSPSTATITETTIVAYPTDSREKRKEKERAAKEAGTPLEVKKKFKHVENHFDDCGEDLSSLQLALDELSSMYIDPLYVDPMTYQGDSDDDYSESELTDQLELFMLCGQNIFTGPVRAVNVDLLPSFFVAKDIEQLTLVVNTRGRGIDVSEICSDDAHTSQLCIRRKYEDGPNFDLVANCDLCDPKDQQACLNYHRDNDVRVAVMAPLRGRPGQNRYLHPQTMWRRQEQTAPTAGVCGSVALTQLRKSRDFFYEQPDPSSFQQEPWPAVLVDRCGTHTARVLNQT